VPKAVAYAVQVARGLAAAHDTVSYVLRYAGLLDETGRECDRAITLDPKNFRWRSCALAFMELGRYDRARDFMVLAAGWEWSAGVSAGLLLRENNSAEALRQSRTAGPNRDWLQACLERRPAAERPARARALEAAQDTLASVRGSAELAAIRKAAMECQQRFLAARAH